MLYLVLASICLLFAIRASNSVSNSKTYFKYLNYTFILLFFIWGFEYYNTVDYGVMLDKYNQVIHKSTYEGEIVAIEPGCVLLFFLCSPIGNLAYYVLVALFEVLVLRLIALKYIPKQYFWILVLLILFQFEYTTVLMTLKRQILAVFTILYGLYLFMERQNIWSRKRLYIILLLLYILAVCFHKSVIIAILFFPLWLLSKYKFNNKVIYIIGVCYVLQYFFDLSQYSTLFFNIIESQDEKYAHYALQIQDGGRETSIIHVGIEILLMVLMLFALKKGKRETKFFILSGLLYLLTVNLFVRDSGRIMLPFRIFELFSIPIIISFIQHKVAKYAVIAVLCVWSAKSTYQVYTNLDKASMTEGFKEFNLIFEAPSLQIDNPKSESKKYLPYRQ